MGCDERGYHYIVYGADARSGGVKAQLPWRPSFRCSSLPGVAYLLVAYTGLCCSLASHELSLIDYQNVGHTVTDSPLE